MKPSEIETLLHMLCNAAQKETLSRFRQDVSVENKLANGFDPVTAADKSAETAIRNIILETCPDHGILGEEQASHNISAEYCWIIDPIDGTRAFVSGLPVWGTLIGLAHQGKPVAGVMHQPFTGEKYYATVQGAWLERNGEKSLLATRQTASLSEATMMTTDPFLFEGREWEVFNALRNTCQLTRYGADCYAFAMVAAGHIDLAIETGLYAFDIVPLVPIIERAGGIITGWDGSDASQGGRVLASANETLHQEALSFLSKL